MSRMVLNRLCHVRGLHWAAVALTLSTGPLAFAQQEAPPPVVQKITAANTQIEMTVESSRILEMANPIPRAQVANPELLDFTVLSEKQVQLHAKKAGLTTVN